MRDRKNYYLFAGLFIVVILVFVSRNKSSQNENSPRKNVSQPISPKVETIDNSIQQPVNEAAKKSAYVETIKQKMDANEQAKKDMASKSLAEQRNFSQIAYLQFTASPKYLFFIKDVDDGMAGIVGRAGKPNEFMAILARQGETSEKDIKDFLPELSAHFPEISAETIKSKAVRAALPTENGSGLKDAVWLVLKSKDTQLYIYRANRIDGKGSYMVLSQGNTIANPSLAQDLQDTVKSFKALPAK